MSEPTKILLIEDNPGDVRLIREMLSEVRTQYNIECVDRLSKGLERLASGGIDIVLLDLGLPDSQGLDTFSKMSKYASRLPIVVLTGLDDEFVGHRSIQEGVQDYLIKGQIDSRLIDRSIRYAIERKMAEDEARKSEDKYRTLYESSKDGIAFSDMQGNLLDANNAYLDMFGYTMEELRELTFQDMSPKKWHEKEADIIKNQIIARGFSNEYEKEYIKKDGTIFPISIRAWLIRDEQEKPTAMWAIVRDITDRKKVEEQQRMVETTRRIMKMKDQFISAVTHELRTPLVSIKGYVDDIVSGEVVEIPEQIASHLEVVRRNTDRLLSLVNDLLDVQRLESGKFQLDLELLDLREVIDHGSKEIQPFIKKKNQKLLIDLPDSPLMVQGDSIRLSQVMMNLLSNATKFAPEKGRITLCVKADKDIFKIQVSDTGIGIRKEDLERIFEIFAKIEKPVYIKGTGLGLSVSKGIVEAHGGKIWAESPGEGKGATFSFTLPVKVKPSILVIDDDRSVVKSLSELLKIEGFDTDSAKDGNEALKKMSLRTYDLALTDIRLPDIDGVKLLKKLKEGNSNMKAMIITGHPSVQNAIEALNEGADAYILKPFEPKNLLAKIKNVLE